MTRRRTGLDADIARIAGQRLPVEFDTEPSDRDEAGRPEATEIEGHGYPPGKGRVRFRLPGLEGEVSRAADKATTWVQTRDLEAFRRLYKAGGEQRAPRFAEFVAAIGRKE